MNEEELTKLLKPMTIKNGVMIHKEPFLHFLKSQVQKWLSLYILFSQENEDIAYRYAKSRIQDCLELEHGEGVLDDKNLETFHQINQSIFNSNIIQTRKD